MGFSFLVSSCNVVRRSFLLSALLTVIVASHAFQFVIAQSTDRERCEAEICHVEIIKDGFIPRTLIVKRGATVVWTNYDESRHTVTSGSPGEITTPLKSLLLDKGDIYQFTFDPSSTYLGSYKYFDQVTRIMRGEIIVEQAKAVKEVTMVQTNAIKIDFNNAKSGVKEISFQNGSVKSVEIDPDVLALIVTLENVVTTGKLHITLDRNLIDAKNDNRDTSFTILVDDKEAFHEEISATPSERALYIVVPSKATKVKVGGTVSLVMLASEALTNAEISITEHKSRGVVVTDAEAKLNEAKDAYDNSMYMDAKILADDAEAIVINLSNVALIASKSIDLAEAAIKEGSAKELDVSKARQFLDLAKQEYVNGNYEKVLSLTQQAKTAASNATAIVKRDVTARAETLAVNNADTRTEALDQAYLMYGAVAASLAAVGAAVYAHVTRRDGAGTAHMSANSETKRVIDLNKILAEKPYLRDYDAEVVKYIVEKGGAAYEAEIREKFNLPKSTAWRLVRRLAREGLVEVKKTGGQNLLRIREEYTQKGNSI
ncbi:MAG: helix-turn-helix domain-containing protein [Nitrososphaerales archaeon]